MKEEKEDINYKHQDGRCTSRMAQFIADLVASMYLYVGTFLTLCTSAINKNCNMTKNISCYRFLPFFLGDPTLFILKNKIITFIFNSFYSTINPRSSS